jgi:2-polyprenyl-3-methyl-5-hydroxy-6-metoxy-1,4-benzoquinol methylase
MQLTKEMQYQPLLDLKESQGLTRLGVMNNQVWQDDPKRLVFTLSRYKFVSKMLEGKHSVLEVGCGDAFCSRVVKQAVNQLTVIDFDPLFVADIIERADPRWPMTAIVHDMLQHPYPETFEAIYTLDVFEHIEKIDEEIFIKNILLSLSPNGVLIIGMPSLESQQYASSQSKEGHVNCKSGDDFRGLLKKHFENVFLFSMNDEVVHTGFSKMAHYLFVICTNQKQNG